MQLVQQHEPGLCLAACVAMLCKTTLAEVRANAVLRKRDGIWFLPDHEAIRFLASRYLCYGLRICPGTALNGAEERFCVNVYLEAAPAILSVRSKNYGPEWNHAVVWCNERRMVLDPLHAEPRPLSDYEVVEWVPISHV
jgi:hypothetical protein